MDFNVGQGPKMVKKGHFGFENVHQKGNFVAKKYSRKISLVNELKEISKKLMLSK